MSAELQQLRAAVAELKAAPIYKKAEKVEPMVDALVAFLTALDAEVVKLASRRAVVSLDAEQFNELVRFEKRITKLEDLQNGKG